MRLPTLKSHLLLVSCTAFIVTSIVVTTFVAQRAIDHRQSAYMDTLSHLFFGSKHALQIRPLDPEFAEGQLEYLLASPKITNITLVDENRTVIAHAGDTQTPQVNPNKFPIDGVLLIDQGPLAIYIEALKSVDAEGNKQAAWIIALVDQKPLSEAKSAVLNTAAFILLFTVLVSVFLSKYLTGYVLKFINRIGAALEDINAGAKHVSFTQFKNGELSEIEESLSKISTQIYRYRNDIREEIEQTTSDLRETLETIEIQNVELDIARKNAVKANNSKSDFLANMSHEIRTPLNSIIGFAKILMRSPLSNHQVDTLRSIQKSSEVLLVIINDILDFSKVEAGRIELEESEFDLYSLIEDVIVMLAPSAHQKDLDLNYLYYNDAPRVIEGDALRLKQVITNLVNNAIKFTNQGEVILRVMLDDSLNDDCDNLKIAITDTGVGLSATDKSDIFNAFSQADASTARKFGGTGLGLSICRGLIHEMKGEIGFDSTLKKGSVFWFTLPLEKEWLDLAPSANSRFDGYTCHILEPQTTSRQNISHTLSSLECNFNYHDDIQSIICSTQSQTSTHSKPLALICLQESDLKQDKTAADLKSLQDAQIPSLLYTPTLTSYDYPSLSLCSLHAIKPVVASTLEHNLNAVSAPELLAASAQKQHAELASFSSKATILAVDDNQINLKLVEALITEMGLKVQLANSGKKALALCKNTFYPLILMDIQMPSMDGPSCLKNIQKLSLYQQNCRVVALTAYALPSEEKTFIEQGFSDLLTKPLDESKLSQVISKHLKLTPLVSTPKQGDIPLPTAHNSNLNNARTNVATSPTFDWQEAVHLSNGNSALAEELNSELFAALPDTRQKIRDAWDAQDFATTESLVHQLHGITLLCGTPALRMATRHAEHQLKTAPAPTKIADAMRVFFEAIDALVAWQKTNSLKAIAQTVRDE